MNISNFTGYNFSDIFEKGPVFKQVQCLTSCTPSLYCQDWFLAVFTLTMMGFLVSVYFKVKLRISQINALKEGKK